MYYSKRSLVYDSSPWYQYYRTENSVKFGWAFGNREQENLVLPFQSNFAEVSVSLNNQNGSEYKRSKLHSKAM